MKPPANKFPSAGSFPTAGAWLAAVCWLGGSGAGTLLAQDRESSTRGNVQTVAATTAAAQPSAAAGQPRGSDAAKQEITETEIVARDGADFDSKGRAATFNGSVHINDPRFELWCDRLTVYLNRETEKDADAVNDRLPPSNNASPAAGAGGGIDHAVAEGHVVIKQTKPAADGGEAKTSIGRSERAEFTNSTGEIVLSGGRPSVEQGLNVLEATSNQTRIILTRDNTLRTQGPSRTIIRQRGDAANNQLPGANRAAETNTPAAGATPKPKSRAPRQSQPNR